MKMLNSIAAALAVFGMWPASVAFAQEGAAKATTDASSSSAQAAFGTVSPMAEGDLGKVAGREDTGAMVASATQRNTVANNSVSGRSTTGGVQLSGNAFQNLQGLAVISANSGNNVAINSSMNVVVNLAPR